MSSSAASSSSLPPSSNNNNLLKNNQTSNQRNLTENSSAAQKIVSSSSIAVIDVKASPLLKLPTLDQNNRVYSPASPRAHQPKYINNNNNDDGVKYKFISNETIGAKASLANEFSDINIEVGESKFWKCSKCLKCTIM